MKELYLFLPHRRKHGEWGGSIEEVQVSLKLFLAAVQVILYDINNRKKT